MVMTKGCGAAMVSAGQNGVKAAGHGTGGAILDTNFGKDEDSWSQSNSWQKDNKGNASHSSSKKGKKQSTRANSRAAAKGRGKVMSTIDQYGVNSAAQGEEGTMVDSNFGQRGDQWGEENAWGRSSNGDKFGWSKKRGTKRNVNSSSKAMGIGKGKAVVQSGRRGTRGSVKGKHGGKVQSKHNIQQDSWGKSNGWNVKDGNRSGFGKKFRKKEDSQGFVDSAAYGDAEIDASTDVSKGVDIRAKGNKGTASRFGFANKTDGFSDSFGWGVQGRRLSATKYSDYQMHVLNKKLNSISNLAKSIKTFLQNSNR